ncbi:hypothetical protein C2U72_07730 [Prosthecomicrobium hirschii]|uniref:hypothetical protein n=1 Tax=Prosthecodimorpha hirschii TaxID=665126 RepID=UPI00112BFD2B|nr:hypothetical protein [Prosthecomicrobium hirschii]TPQ51563.1 hypothetical protein C2U72_07730 [Prosthecomicrobium hirschii]
MTKVKQEPIAPNQAALVLGLDAFVKISAVEGLSLSTESLAMFADFDKNDLTDHQRRAAIIAKHMKKP